MLTKRLFLVLIAGLIFNYTIPATKKDRATQQRSSAATVITLSTPSPTPTRVSTTPAAAIIRDHLRSIGQQHNYRYTPPQPANMQVRHAHHKHAHNQQQNHKQRQDKHTQQKHAAPKKQAHEKAIVHAATEQQQSTDASTLHQFLPIVRPSSRTPGSTPRLNSNSRKPLVQNLPSHYPAIPCLNIKDVPKILAAQEEAARIAAIQQAIQEEHKKAEAESAERRGAEILREQQLLALRTRNNQ